MTLTFEAFMATRTWSDDLTVQIEELATATDEPTKPQGYVYVGHLHIEKVAYHWPEAARKQGAWYLRLGNLEWITDDLPSLERRLYEYALTEGYSAAS